MMSAERESNHLDMTMITDQVQLHYEMSTC